MGAFVGLLRGINVGGHRKVPMAALRELAEAEGLRAVRTYVASGNIVFESDAEEGELETLLERAIADRFGFDVDVIVRSGSRWRGYAESNPFPEESTRAPNLVMMTVGKQAATDADIEALRGRAGANERVERREDAIWIWFGDGAGRSKLGAGEAKGVWTTRTGAPSLPSRRCSRNEQDRAAPLADRGCNRGGRGCDPPLDGPPANLHLRKHQALDRRRS